jgi:T5SS/PEP-CTERM-associated repeat protein
MKRSMNLDRTAIARHHSWDGPFRTTRARLLLALMISLTPWFCGAQLVADGGTNILDGGSATITGNITVGTNSSFTLLMLTNNAFVTNTASANIGSSVGAKSNSVVITGVGSEWDPAFGFVVGVSGSFNSLSVMDGGKATGVMYVGQNASSSNNAVVVTGPGSTWDKAAYTYVGENGRGNRLIVTNGGMVSSANVQIGTFGVSNLVVVTGTNSLWSFAGMSIGGPSVGGAFNGMLVSNGGTVGTTGVSTIGSYASSNSVVITGPGSRWTNASYFMVGYNYPGNELIVSNGAVVSADSTYVGDNGGWQERLLVTGAGSLLTNRSDFFHGRAGSSNQLIVANGGTLADNIGYLGYGGFVPGVNQALVTDAGSIWKNRTDLNIGYNAQRSQLVISNGGKVFNEYAYIGNGISSSNNLVVITGPGSWWSNHYDLYIGNNGASNQLAVNNGGLVTGRNFYLGYNGSSTSNLLTITGGNIVLTNSSNLEVIRGTVILNSGLLRLDRLLMNASTQGKLIFNGGTLQPGSGNVNNGSAFVVGDGTNAATLSLANDHFAPGGAHAFAGGLVISSNAVLTGAGTVIGNVFVRSGAMIAPGTSNNLFTTLNGSLVLSNGSSTVLKLNALSASAWHFEGATSVTLGGTLRLTNLAGAFGDGQSFRLFSSSNLQGAFSSITPTSPGPGLKWNTNQLSVDGTLRVCNIHALPPVITSAQCTASNFLIYASAGVPYDPCFVLTSTNLTSWEYRMTNTFNTYGNVTITNVVFLDEPARFFRLQVE